MKRRSKEICDGWAKIGVSWTLKGVRMPLMRFMDVPRAIGRRMMRDEWA